MQIRKGRSQGDSQFMSRGRSAGVLDRNVFNATLRLISQQSWLNKKATELDYLVNSCPSDEHRMMIIKLLTITRHVTGSEYFDTIDLLRGHIEDSWLLLSKETIFTSASDKSHTDSSQEVLNQLKSAHWQGAGWNKNRFLKSFKDASSQINSDATLVIVDDIIGSGISMLTALAWFRAEMHVLKKNFHLKVVSVAGCREGVTAIREAGYDIYCPIVVKKGLTDYVLGKDLEAALEMMTQLENALLSKLKNKKSFNDYRFGWGRQEAVYVRHGGNTPNNVFPVFWWDKIKGGKRPTVMHRT